MAPRTSKKARKPLSKKSMKLAKGGAAPGGRISGLAVDPSDSTTQRTRQTSIVVDL